MPISYGDRLVLPPKSSIYFTKTDGTLQEVLRSDESDLISIRSPITFADTLGVTGALSLASVATSGAATIGTTLGVTGTSTLGALNAGATTTTTLGATGNVTVTSGDVIVATAGKGLKIKEGSNARMGTATLVSGTVTVSNTSVTASSRILLSRYSAGASTALGILSVGTVAASTSFIINALKEADATVQTNDVSVVHWVLLEPSA